MATVYKCRNGSCRFNCDLKCELDEIELTNCGECASYEEGEWEGCEW